MEITFKLSVYKVQDRKNGNVKYVVGPDYDLSENNPSLISCKKTIAGVFDFEDCGEMAWEDFLRFRNFKNLDFVKIESLEELPADVRKIVPYLVEITQIQESVVGPQTDYLFSGEHSIEDYFKEI